ncbi:MAG TPA: YggT family protein [Rhodanobacteraceae bacterium]|nr:YggT family protein [Rhodanobacteraceae bacterium]
MGYLANAARILIDFAFGAVLCWLLLRLLAEYWRADFRNPICQFLYKSTHALLRPFARVLPSWRRINLAVLVLAFAAEVLKLVLLFATLGLLPAAGGLLLLALTELIDFLLILYIVLIIGWALLSMLGTDSRHPLVPLVNQLTQPLMRPLQKRLPTPAGIDFSPAIAVLALVLLRALLLQPLTDIAQRLLG